MNTLLKLAMSGVAGWFAYPTIEHHTLATWIMLNGKTLPSVGVDAVLLLVKGMALRDPQMANGLMALQSVSGVISFAVAALFVFGGARLLQRREEPVYELPQHLRDLLGPTEPHLGKR